MKNNLNQIFPVMSFQDGQMPKEETNMLPQNIAIVHVDLAQILDEQASWMLKAFELGIRCGRKEEKENG